MTDELWYIINLVVSSFALGFVTAIALLGG